MFALGCQKEVELKQQLKSSPRKSLKCGFHDYMSFYVEWNKQPISCCIKWIDIWLSFKKCCCTSTNTTQLIQHFHQEQYRSNTNDNDDNTATEEFHSSFAEEEF